MVRENKNGFKSFLCNAQLRFMFYRQTLTKFVYFLIFYGRHDTSGRFCDFSPRFFFRLTTTTINGIKIPGTMYTATSAFKVTICLEWGVGTNVYGDID